MVRLGETARRTRMKPTMTPALRHSDADRKLLLLAIWKLLRRVTRRISKSMQMTADPRMQAVKPSQSGLGRMSPDQLTDA